MASRSRSGKDRAAKAAITAGLTAAGVPAPVAGLAAKGVIAGAKFSWRHPVATIGAFSLIALWPVALVIVIVSVVAGFVVISAVQPQTLNVAPSKAALAAIPRQYLSVYEDVANQDEVPWIVLAGLGEELTKQGTTSPYDSIVRKTTYPVVSPPIGGKGNQGSGPMLLDSAAAKQLGAAKAQAVQASVGLIGYDLEQAAQQLASEDGLDYATELEEPLAETSSFWVQAVSMLPIAHTPQSCAPGTGYTSVSSEIESIWSCELTGKKIYLEAGPGVTVPAGEASTELIAEALQVSWAYSKWGTTGCSAAGSVFPLPGGLPNTVNRCDAVSNITEAAKLVIAAAETPIDNRTAPEWSVLPGVFIAPKSPISQTTPGPDIWRKAAPASDACVSAVEQNLALLPEPGPFSPDLISSVTLTAAQLKARDSTDAARYAAAWSSGSLSTLNASTTCQTPGAGTNGSSKTIPKSIWYQEVATIAGQALERDEAVSGESSSDSNLAGLVSWLDKKAKLSAPTIGKNSLVPRLADPPIALVTASPGTPIPEGTAGVPALAVSIASTYDGTPGAVTINASGAQTLGAIGSLDGVPTDWVQWAQEATSAECSGLSPLVLLAIGENETTWGESTLPGVSSGANSFGAEGPMQFLPSTFAAYAVSVNGDVPNIYNPEDALFAAAKYLCANEAATNWQSAVFQYCGGDSGRPGAAAQCNGYVSKVSSEMAAWTQANLTSAILPTGALGMFIETAMAQIGLPYIWGGQSAGIGFDCSGLVDYSLVKAGIDPSGVYLGQNGSHGATAQMLYNATAQNTVVGAPSPGDLVFFGGGTSSVEHVGIYIGNNEMVDAPETGQDVQTQSYAWPDLVAVTSLSASGASS